MSLKPFWAYYGGKWRAAPRYPAPLGGEIVEPFAGAAGYSTRHAHLNVTLFDADPTIAGLWDYLIHVDSAEILALPDVVDEVPASLPQEARWLIGFWLNKGAASPCKSPSAWMRSGIRPNSYWCSAVRQRIASQVSSIRHWRVAQKSWAEIDVERFAGATWYVDPPYVKAGKHYKYSDVDYTALGAWCRRLPGQVMVCEAQGADWLPFESFREIKASPSSRGGKKSAEVLWYKDDTVRVFGVAEVRRWP